LKIYPGSALATLLTKVYIKLDGFVKSPSAALRFNFVVAAHL
jgi:hypothetical protein